jgi:hypothetical protein
VNEAAAKAFLLFNKNVGRASFDWRQEEKLWRDTEDLRMSGLLRTEQFCLRSQIRVFGLEVCAEQT